MRVSSTLCDICPILETYNDGQDIQVFETKHWRGVLDADQRSLGKMFITLLDHKQSIADLSAEELSELFAVMKSLENALKRAYQPTHFNWQCLMNLAIEAGKETHVHWHFHPRYDEVKTVNNHEFSDGVKDKTLNIVDAKTLKVIKNDIVSQLSLPGSV